MTQRENQCQSLLENDQGITTLLNGLMANQHLCFGNEKLKKIVYIYTYDIENTVGAENQVNRFEKLYEGYNNIYSEIDISDKVVVTLTYNLENINIDELHEIDDTITDSYKKFKKQISSYKCNKR